MLAEFHLQTKRNKAFTIARMRAVKAKTMHFQQPLKAGVSMSDGTANPKQLQRVRKAANRTHAHTELMLHYCVWGVLWVAEVLFCRLSANKTLQSKLSSKLFVLLHKLCRNMHSLLIHCGKITGNQLMFPIWLVWIKLFRGM